MMAQGRPQSLKCDLLAFLLMLQIVVDFVLQLVGVFKGIQIPARTVIIAQILADIGQLHGPAGTDFIGSRINGTGGKLERVPVILPALPRTVNINDQLGTAVIICGLLGRNEAVFDKR
ncbi:hypothetical protein D3C74_410440 [compost metagenome]